MSVVSVRISGFIRLVSSVVVCASTSLLPASPAAAAELPPCMANGEVLPINNDQVQVWEDTTTNAYHSRAHIKGPLINLYPDQTGHHHIAVQIGATSEDSVEVIYNMQFGALPDLNMGADIEACGDYITATAPNGPYPKSPNNAILHWVHRSDSPHHDSGFVAVAGILYGW